MLPQETQGTYGTREETEFLETVYLFVGRLAEDGAVAVNEKDSLPTHIDAF